MSSEWNHYLCRACYAIVEPGREPVTVGGSNGRCCRCHVKSGSGIFYRKQPGFFNFCTMADSIHHDQY